MLRPDGVLAALRRRSALRTPRGPRGLRGGRRGGGLGRRGDGPARGGSSDTAAVHELRGGLGLAPEARQGTALGLHLLRQAPRGVAVPGQRETDHDLDCLEVVVRIRGTEDEDVPLEGEAVGADALLQPGDDLARGVAQLGLRGAERREALEADLARLAVEPVVPVRRVGRDQHHRGVVGPPQVVAPDEPVGRGDGSRGGLGHQVSPLNESDMCDSTTGYTHCVTLVIEYGQHYITNAYFCQYIIQYKLIQ